MSFADDDGVERFGYVQVPADAPGVRIDGDWDALGMRASGSHSITLDDVRLPAAALRGGFAAGEPAPYLERNLASGLFHAPASLGIAEAAFARVAVPERVGDDARARMLVAEAAIDLAAARGVVARAASLVDEHHAAHPADDGGDDEIVAVFSEGQAAKAFVGDAATRVVDRALALSGGAGYLNGSPLARAYRDVRAGAFMHPLGANRVVRVPCADGARPASAALVAMRGLGSPGAGDRRARVAARARPLRHRRDAHHRARR